MKKSTFTYLITLLLWFCIAGTFLYIHFNTTKQVAQKVESGQKYLKNNDLVKAELSFEEAIKIDPKKEEPYVELIKIYKKKKEPEKLKKIVKEFKKNVEKPKLINTASIKELEVSIRRDDYSSIIESYEEKYGVCSSDYYDEYSEKLTGLCFAKLIDFDQNGIDELILVYTKINENGYYNVAEYSVYSYDDETMETISLAENKELPYFQEFEGSIVSFITLPDLGTCLIIDSTNDNEDEAYPKEWLIFEQAYYSLKDNEWKPVQKLKFTEISEYSDEYDENSDNLTKIYIDGEFVTNDVQYMDDLYDITDTYPLDNFGGLDLSKTKETLYETKKALGMVE